jgi:hypothetical protein
MSSVFGGSQATGNNQSTNQSSNQAYPMLSQALGGQTTTGTDASSQLAGLLGVGGGTTAQQQAAQQQAFQGFQNSTGYQFGLNQGTQGITQNAATSGLLNSGATAKAVDTYGQNYANTQYQNYLNPLQSLVSSGNQAGSVIGGVGQQSSGESTGTSSSNSKPGIGGFIGQGMSGLASLGVKI